MNPTSWARWLDPAEPLGWQCPSCHTGMLVSTAEKPVQIESLKTRRMELSGHGHAGDVDDYFTWVLKCANSSCREHVVLLGRFGFMPVYDGEEDDPREHWIPAVSPLSVHPAPHLIEIPTKTPKAVKVELERAFGLFWADASAATSRVRTAVERTLTDQGVPTATPAGKFHSLDQRIKALEKLHPEHRDVIEHLHSIRFLGNAGTHDDVDDEALLDALAIIEQVIDALYDGRSSQVRQRVKEINARRGPRSKPPRS